MTRKRIQLEISNDQAEKLYNYLANLSNSEFVRRWFAGSLMDEFVIVPSNQEWQIKMSSGHPVLARKYIYTREQYVNCWTSKLVLTLTDNEKEFLDFAKTRFEQDDDLDGIDFDEFRWECGLDN